MGVPKHVIHALAILMWNNVFQFGDTFWHQLHGTAMGVSPACMWATCFYAPHEEHLMEKYSAYLLFYRRYIDDVFAVWDFCSRKSHKLFRRFKRDLWFAGLQWTVDDPSDSVVFLDTTITLQNGNLETRLYEKHLNLYLYLPPTSAHPPGVLHVGGGHSLDGPGA